MANQTAIHQYILIQGDGASLNAVVNLKTTPILLRSSYGTVLNFDTLPDAVTVVQAYDSVGNDVASQFTIAINGSKLTYHFTTPFSDLRAFLIELLYNI